MGLEYGKDRMVGVHQVNSVDFVRTAFDVYNSGEVLVFIKQDIPELQLKKIITPAAGGGWFDFKQSVIQEDKPAQVVFTSGTEGVPKAILISHGALADVVIRLNKMMQVDSGIREYIGVPVTYSFGFGRCRAIAAAGGRGYIPENGFNPSEIAKMLASGEINAISAVPTLWRALMLQSEIIGDLGAHVKWIEIGSQYMSRAEKEKMKALFPNAIIVQHYGLTEASRTTLLNVSKMEGEQLDSVGEAVGGVETRISTEGRIQIRGPHIAMGSIVNGNVESLVDEEGWYTTSDIGHMENNFLYYEGRADDLINCGGIKISPDLLQEKLSKKLKAENRLAISKIPDELRGDGVLVTIEKSAGLDASKVHDLAIYELQEMGVNAKSAIKIQQVDIIPRTDTGKVQRKKVSALYEAVTTKEKSEAKTCYASVSEIYAGVFRDASIRKEDTFRSLGGDSLNYIEMLVLLEKHFGFVPNDWDKKTINELDKIKISRSTKFISWIDVSVFLRVLAILGVVATHSGFMSFGGGTLLLFMLIGFNLARFKFEEFTGEGVWKWLTTYAVIILIPYYLLAVVYEVENGTFELSRLLLFGNFVNAKLTILFPFWFVQALLQSLIIVGAFFSISSIKRLAIKEPFQFSIYILLFLFALRVSYQKLWEAAFQAGIYEYAHNDMLPFRLLAIIWLGWTIYFTRSYIQKLTVCTIGIAFAFLDTALLWGFDFNAPQTNLSGATKWMVLGCVLLAFVPRVPVLSIGKRIINDIGAATFYIFVLNGIWIKFAEKILHIEFKFGLFFISLIGSMFIWWFAEHIDITGRLKNYAGYFKKTNKIPLNTNP